ncbi:MAG: hypothetical protein RL141_512 [Candidatus Parcubacteria bacterium]|jgi:hypothetical protein
MKKELDSTEKERIHEAAIQFLRTNHTMVLATVSNTGEPSAAVVYFTHQEPFEFHILTVKGSRKCENIKANGKIAFVIGTGPDTDTMQGGGVAELMEEKEAEIFFELVERISLTSPFQWPVLALAKEHGFCAFRIRPTWLTWLVMDEEEYPDIARKEFYQLI